jgi:PAS domain S-box-containing protein
MVIDNDKSQSAEAAEMRCRAEERLTAQAPEARLSRTEDQTQRLLHELQVHRIELEMQNAELRHARDEVETALAKYTDLYDFAPVGYFTLDRLGNIRAANLTTAGLLGVERSRLIGRRFGQFIANDARPGFTAFLRKVFESRVKDVCEVALLHEGKTPLIVQIEAVSAVSGQECRVAVIEITDRKRAEEEIEILNTSLAAHAAELEIVNQDLEAFSYTVSHDLRKPLTNINCFCQIIQEVFGPGLKKECRDYVRDILAETLRMDRLIDTILTFSRLTRSPLHPGPVNLSDIAAKVTASLSRGAPERRHEFRIAGGMVAEGDYKFLQVVMENLLGNAWKYTGTRKKAVIEFGEMEAGGGMAYFVRDNGVGFDMANADKLFIPFERLHGAAEFEGNGIGLATVHRIIQRHGGRIWAEGKPGKGAAFWFTL